MPPRQMARTGYCDGSCCEEERMGSTAGAEVEERTSGPSSQPGVGSFRLVHGANPSTRIIRFSIFSSFGS